MTQYRSLRCPGHDRSPILPLPHPLAQHVSDSARRIALGQDVSRTALLEDIEKDDHLFMCRRVDAGTAAGACQVVDPPVSPYVYHAVRALFTQRRVEVVPALTSMILDRPLVPIHRGG